MSHEDFDLNIESYSILELLNFFNVPTTATKEQLLEVYDIKKEEIEKIENELSKKNLLNFINKAYNLVKKYFNFPEPVLEKKVYRDLEIPNFIPEQNHRVNPIQREEIKQVISIDSAFREVSEPPTTPSDFIINLPFELNHVSKMRLISSEIPYTFYFFSKKKKNNTFSITITNSTIIETYNIIIPDGTWHSSDFENQINEYFNKNTTGVDLISYLKFDGSGEEYHNGKAIIRFKTHDEISLLNTTYGYFLDPNLPASGALSYFLTIPDITNNIITFEQSSLFFMGFVKSDLNTIINSNNTYNTFSFTHIGVLIATNVFGKDINSYLFISINDFVGNSKDQIISCFNNGYLGKNILARIQITNPEFTFIINNSGDHIFKERNYFGNVKIRKLHIQILNKYGEVVQLNGSEVSLALEFTQNYDSKNQLKFNSILNNDRQQQIFF
tara:strand:+ start:11884 stop:13212 length:1329 start_codon:yes stop_codon:yes gene_type:complete